MCSWAQQEFVSLDLGDVRRNRRVAEVTEALTARPGLSIPHVFQDKAAMNGAYYSWNSPFVTPQAILGAHRDATIARLADLPEVLVANDTTNLDFTTHDSVEDLGYLDSRSRRGLMAHTALAMSPDGVPLGVLHQEVWSRLLSEQGKAKARQQRETKDKESAKWLNALDTIQQAVPATVVAIVIGDAESDVYAVFAHPREAHVELLVRSAQNRRVGGQALLKPTVEAVLPCGMLTVEIPRADKREARTAKLVLRFATVSIQPPKNAPNRKALHPIEVRAILAREEMPPKDGSEPIYWLLLTTQQVSNAGEAAKYVGYYARRWLIERFHFVLKSGCRIERLQMASVDALETALATFNVVAWRLLYLTHIARVTPDAPCDRVFELAEWQALCCRIQKAPTPPKKPPTIREAVRMIASLGGFLGRKSDGEPGVKTLWQGLVALHECVEMFAAMRGIGPPIRDLQSFRER